MTYYFVWLISFLLLLLSLLLTPWQNVASITTPYLHYPRTAVDSTTRTLNILLQTLYYSISYTSSLSYHSSSSCSFSTEKEGIVSQALKCACRGFYITTHQLRFPRILLTDKQVGSEEVGEERESEKQMGRDERHGCGRQELDNYNNSELQITEGDAVLNKVDYYLNYRFTLRALVWYGN